MLGSIRLSILQVLLLQPISTNVMTADLFNGNAGLLSVSSATFNVETTNLNVAVANATSNRFRVPGTTTTVSFSYTGADQTFTVPTNVYSLVITSMIGGGGGGKYFRDLFHVPGKGGLWFLEH
jgi:hypothetical protein